MKRPTIHYEGYQPDLLGAMGTHDYTVRIGKKSVRIQIPAPMDKQPDQSRIDEAVAGIRTNPQKPLAII